MGIFRMPSLGADMEAGKLVEWLKQPGDTVTSGDVIAVVETQKGAIEIEVFESGTLESHLLPVGATVPVGTGIAMIHATEPGVVQMARPAAPAPQIVAPVAPPVPSAPREPEPREISAAPTEMNVSPAARRFAADHGIDLSAIRGTGPGGAIVYVDVETAWLSREKAGATGEPGPPPAPAAAAAGPDGMRAAIAAAMARSKREIPHYYLAHAADVTVAMEWMAARNEARPPEARLVFATLLVKALALALAKYPEFNGHFRDGHFMPSLTAHVGIAIALRGGGLVAPAIHDAAGLSLDQLMGRVLDLTNRVRAGRFRGSELADPTITLTSLGERGVDRVQPVIYPPQVAIVGAGTPALRPWVVEGAVVPRQLCELSLAADHRVSDGHRGSLFLRDIAQRLQSPGGL